MNLSSTDSAAVLPRVSPIVAAAGVALLLGAVFYLSLPNDSLWQRVVEDAGHGPVFAGIAIILLLLRTPPPGQATRSVAQYLVAFGMAVLLGIATELLQYRLPGRSVSWLDVVHDAAGAALGLAIVCGIERSLARRRGIVCRGATPCVLLAIALSGFLLLAWQPLQCARAYATRAAAWPTLTPLGRVADAAFSQVQDARASYVPLPPQYRRPGDADSLRLAHGSGARPGLHLLEPVPDWSEFDVLALDLTNPATSKARFLIRVHDAAHDNTHEDRFNQVIVVPAETRATVRISLAAIAATPRNRRLDLTEVAGLILVMRRPPAAGEFYVTRVWLE